MFEYIDSMNFNMGLAKNKIARKCVDRSKKKYVEKVKRPIDQKCTIDVLKCVAKAILAFTDDDHDKAFCIKEDIWMSDYACQYVVKYFQKPNPKTEIPSEYDKFFGQPISTFEYADIIKFVGRRRGKGNANYYKVKRRNELELIAADLDNSYEFLLKFITKLARDSHLMPVLDRFFDEQSETSYEALRKKYSDYMDKKTNINNEKEKGRIFTKIVNVLAMSKSKKGTVRGHISKRPIGYNDILYNRPNFIFDNTNKSKNISRNEFKRLVEAERIIMVQLGLDSSDSAMAKAKERLRKYNDMYRAKRSEVLVHDDGAEEREAHHIFPQHLDEYKCIRACTENLILLTSSQHDYYAHRRDKNYIDPDFQIACIKSKIDRIEEYTINCPNGGLYLFERLKTVLNIGLKTDVMTSVNDGDFRALREKLEEYLEKQD